MRLQEKWGHECFARLYPRYVEFARKTNSREGREPTDADVLMAHTENMARLQRVFSSWKEFAKDAEFHSGQEKVELAYVLGVFDGITGYPGFWGGRAYLLVTNERILCLNRSRTTPWIRGDVRLEKGESVVSVRPLLGIGGDVTKDLDFRKDAREFMPTLPTSDKEHAAVALLTDTRMLVVDACGGWFHYISVPTEKNESVIGSLGNYAAGSVLVVTDRRLVHWKLSWTKKEPQFNVFVPESGIVIAILPRRKTILSALRSPYELVIQAGDQTAKFGVEEGDLPLARRIEAMFAGMAA
jgi:hypothetical protein